MALQRTGIEAVVHEAYDAPSDYAGLFLNTASNGLQLPDDTVSVVVRHGLLDGQRVGAAPRPRRGQQTTASKAEVRRPVQVDLTGLRPKP
jgi:hypothetical protein